MVVHAAAASSLQWTHLNRLRASRSLPALADLIRAADLTGAQATFAPETIATTCQALVQYGPAAPPELIGVVRRWARSCPQAISATAASKFLQASALFPEDDFRRGLIGTFVSDLDSCGAGAVVGGAMVLARSPFDRSIWEKVVARANRLPLSISEMAKLAGAYARAGLQIQHPALISTAFTPIVERLGKSNIVGLRAGRCAELVWALSKTAMLPKKWAETVVVPRLVKEMDRLEPQLLSQFVCSLAHTATCPSELFTALEQRLQRDRDGFGDYSSQSMANLCWSLAVARRSAALPILWSAFANRPGISTTEFAQIHQSFEWADKFAKSLIAPETLELRSAAKTAFFDMVPTTDSSTDLLRSVKSAAESIWPEIEAEVQCPKTGYWLDLVRPNRTQILEVNGPQHYCRLSSRLRGSSLLKASILRRSGWSLKPIPYFEWSFGRSNLPAQTHYLRVKTMGID